MLCSGKFKAFAKSQGAASPAWLVIKYCELGELMIHHSGAAAAAAADEEAAEAAVEAEEDGPHSRGGGRVVIPLGGAGGGRKIGAADLSAEEEDEDDGEIRLLPASERSEGAASAAAVEFERPLVESFLKLASLIVRGFFSLRGVQISEIFYGGKKIQALFGAKDRSALTL